VILGPWRIATTPPAALVLLHHEPDRPSRPRTERPGPVTEKGSLPHHLPPTSIHALDHKTTAVIYNTHSKLFSTEIVRRLMPPALQALYPQHRRPGRHDL